jgi:hypothetical protein
MSDIKYRLEQAIENFPEIQENPLETFQDALKYILKLEEEIRILERS